jgi:hypothetical protein
MVITGDKLAEVRWAAVLGCLLVGCPLRPAPLTPGGDGGSGGAGGKAPIVITDERVCSHLLDLGCAEGKDTACRPTLAHLRASPGVRPLPDLACILSARDRPSVRVCQGIQCPESRP